MMRPMATARHSATQAKGKAGGMAGGDPAEYPGRQDARRACYEGNEAEGCRAVCGHLRCCHVEQAGADDCKAKAHACKGHNT